MGLDLVVVMEVDDGIGFGFDLTIGVTVVR